jgi:hypothetical protein
MFFGSHPKKQVRRYPDKFLSQQKFSRGRNSSPAHRFSFMGKDKKCYKCIFL